MTAIIEVLMEVGSLGYVYLGRVVAAGVRPVGGLLEGVLRGW